MVEGQLAHLAFDAGAVDGDGRLRPLQGAHHLCDGRSTEPDALQLRQHRSLPRRIGQTGARAPPFAGCLVQLGRSASQISNADTA